MRAASPGLYVNEANCHPFQNGRFLWMHNGDIAGFELIRCKLRTALSDAAYDAIEGTTDSEHAFALFLDRLAPRFDDYEVGDIQAALVETIHQLDAWTVEAGTETPSHYNFAVTDGNSVVVTRYVSQDGAPAHSLYVAVGERFENVDGHYVMEPTDGAPDAVIVASEPLTEDRSFWREVPANSMVTVTPELHVHTAAID
ncbi:MAG: class II glutamine amidotransferase [Alphaproteobacteria bacterium]